MAISLTKRQLEVLRKMRDEGEELAIDGTVGYVGTERISYSTFRAFLENVLISRESYSSIYWHINESGLRLLDGHKDIYRMADGRYVEDWRL